MGVIVGDWKNFTFHKASSKELVKICQHIRANLLKDETMNANLGWCEENAKAYDELVRIALGHGISIYVTEKGSDEVIGVNILTDSRFEDLSNLKFPSKVTMTLLGMIDKLHETTNQIFHNNYRKYGHFIEIFITSIDSKYRGVGIATEMYIRTLNYAKELGFKMIKANFSSPGTRAIAKKLGFIEIGKLYFKDQADETGMKLFPNIGDDEFITDTIKIL